MDITNYISRSELKIRLDAIPGRSKEHDVKYSILKVYTDRNNILTTEEQLPNKRQRVEKKSFDPDIDNLQGQFVGPDIYPLPKRNQNKKELKSSTEKATEKTSNIDSSKVITLHHESISSDTKNSKSTNEKNEINSENTNEELNINEADISIEKKARGRPKKESQPIIEKVINIEEKIIDDGGKRKRTKKEFFDSEIQVNVSSVTTKKLKEPKISKITSNEINSIPNEEKTVKKINITKVNNK